MDTDMVESDSDLDLGNSGDEDDEEDEGSEDKEDLGPTDEVSAKKHLINSNDSDILSEPKPTTQEIISLLNKKLRHRKLFLYL